MFETFDSFAIRQCLAGQEVPEIAIKPWVHATRSIPDGKNKRISGHTKIVSCLEPQARCAPPPKEVRPRFNAPLLSDSHADGCERP